MRKKNKGAIRETSGLAKVLIYIQLILLSILIIVPVFWVFMASIKENLEFYRNPWALPEGFYFQNFIDAWGKCEYGLLYAQFCICDGGCDFPACDHCASGIICTGKIQV